MTQQSKQGGLTDQLPTAELVAELRNLMGALGERAVSTVTGRVAGMTDRLTDYAGKGGRQIGSAVRGGAEKAAGEALKGDGKGLAPTLVSAGASAARKAAAGAVKGAANTAKQAISGGGDGERPEAKVTNIVEEIDVGVPVTVAYNQWTQFADFPSFMKKVEAVEQDSDEKLRWTARILWSHRTWESTIIEQVPDERIVWRSEGDKGSVDGAVTFHEVAPNLTRIMLVLEYHPAGFFERTGNLWRAQGRRARLELKHFKRHVMTRTVLHPEELEGWRGEIRDGEVVSTGEAEDAKPEAEEPRETSRTRKESPTRTSAAEPKERPTPRRVRRPTGDEDNQRPRRPARRAESTTGRAERRPRARNTKPAGSD